MKPNASPLALIACFVTLSSVHSGSALAEPLPQITPVPLSDIPTDSLIKETKRLERKSQEIGKQAEDSLPAKSEEKSPSQQKQGSSALNLPMPAKQDRTKLSAEQRQDATRLPSIESAPKLGLSGWLGQTLELDAKIVSRKSADPNEKNWAAWILNGNVICRAETCSLPLDGKTVDVGIHSLIFLAYNSYGSVMTRHVLRVMRGNWNPLLPFDPKQKRAIASQPATTEAKQADKSLLHIWATEGNAVQAYPENVVLFGSVPRNSTWDGRIKTAPRGIIRIIDPNMGKWFILNGTDVALVPKKEPKNQLDMFVMRGTIRAQSAKKAVANNPQRVMRNDLLISTEEASIYLDDGIDAFVFRVAPPSAALAKRKTKGDITNLTKEEQYTTHIIPLSGIARMKLNKSKSEEVKTVEIPPGVEIVLYEDGTVGQFQRPKPDLMEKLIRQTMTQEEIAERARKKAEAAKMVVDLPTQIKKVEELAAREDYFEMLNELAPIEDRKSEDARISYFLGVANRGLYQNIEAEKHFIAATEQDKDYADAPWQLGLMYLEEKNWEKAEIALSKARSRMNSDDKRTQEYEYYAGVSNYNMDADFFAKNNFTKSLLWGQDLEAALKASSADFLKKLRQRKMWSIAVPLGVQWDGNPLSLESGADLPKGYSSRSLYRGIAGTVFTWDPSSAEDGPGKFYGGSGTVMYAKHYPSSFKAFDTLILAASATQTFRKEVPATPSPAPAPAAPESPTPSATPPPPPPPQLETLKFTESVSMPLVENKLQTVSLNGSVGFKGVDAGVGFDYDVVGESDAKKHAFTGKEAYTLAVWSDQGGKRFDVDFSADQRYGLKKLDSAGSSFALNSSPAYTLPLGLLSTVKLACGFGFQKNFFGPELLTLKATPNLNFTRFLTPWLIALGSVSYETSMQKASAGSTSGDSILILKPGAGITLSGMF